MAITKEQLNKMTGPELVALYNKHNQGTKIVKFSDRSTAIKRIMAMDGFEDLKGTAPAKKAEAREKAPKKEKGEKKLGVIAIAHEFCKREDGATMDELGAHLKKVFPDRNELGMLSTARLNLRPSCTPGFQRDKKKIEGRGWVYFLKVDRG